MRPLKFGGLRRMLFLQSCRAAPGFNPLATLTFYPPVYMYGKVDKYDYFTP